MRNENAKKVAFGGLFGAAALVVMCLGGMIPLATYICPVLCMVLLSVVYNTCGGRIGWAWYVMVAFLSALMAPDKEAAAVYVFLGYYPIVKASIDRLKFKWLIKFVYFNITILVTYLVIIYLLGLDQVVADYQGMGIISVAALLLLGNVTFYMLDKMLSMVNRRFIK